jgi:hypothetical protein
MAGGIRRQRLEPDEIEHVDRRVAWQRLEPVKIRPIGIDVAIHHALQR